MNTVQLREMDGGRYQVLGPLTFDTVPEVYAKFAPWAGPAREFVIDLARVERADSAGLALLLEWLRAAHAHDRGIRFVNIPAQLRALIHVSGLTATFPEQTG